MNGMLLIRKASSLLLMVLLSVLLNACGGDGGDSSGVLPVDSTPLNGKVIDSYISDATVFLDKNRNLALDDGEPSALSDNNGAYSLSLTEADIAALPTSPVVALVAAGAKDIDTGETFTEVNDFVLTAPPILNFDPAQADSFSQAITPFTTQLYNEVKEILALVVSGDLNTDTLTIAIGAAKSTVLGKTAAKLEIETDALKDRLFNDFLEQTGEVILEPSELQALTEQAESLTDVLQDSKAIEDEMAATLEDNQQANVKISEYSFIEWHSGETLFLQELSKAVITTQNNGDKQIEWETTKYRLNADGTQMLVAGEPLIYEVSSYTENKNVDGTFEGESKTVRDTNGDNQRLLKSQTYQQGTWSATSREYTQYFDESAPSVELPDITWGGERSYQGSDIKTAVLAGDYTDIDFIQNKIETNVYENSQLISTIFSNEFNRIEGELNLEKADYAHTRIVTQSTTRVLHENKSDWGADGFINAYTADQVLYNGNTIKTTGHPVWPGNNSDQWQEYADYNFNDKPFGSFWLEEIITNKKVDGLDVVISEGARYLLDSSTNTAKVDSEKNKYQFNSWLSTTTHRTAELSVEQVEWNHIHLDDALFNFPDENFTFNDLGQEVTYSVKYAHDIWLVWSFPEWGGRNIPNLLEVVDTQLSANENDYSTVDISELMVEGSVTAEPNKILPTESFIKDELGDVRTWYIVTNTFDGELKLHETTLPNLNADWVFIFVPGSTFIYVPDGFYFENWNYTTQNIGIPPISEMNTEKGSFSFSPGFGWNPEYPFHIYLDKAEAEAKFAQLSVMNGAFKTVFATSWYSGANLGGVTGADLLCQQAAGNAGLGGEYLAWIASSDANAPINRFTRSDLPYVLVDGGVVAYDWDDLVDGSIRLPIDLTPPPDHSYPDPIGVWTGVDATGGFAGGWACDGWTSACYGPECQGGLQGWTHRTDSRWTESSTTDCENPGLLYCFQQ